MGLGESERGTVEIAVTRSIGEDGAVVVFIDTDFEPTGADGGPGLRVLVNDGDAFIGKPFVYTEVDHDAKTVKLTVEPREIAYVTDETKES